MRNRALRLDLAIDSYILSHHDQTHIDEELLQLVLGALLALQEELDERE